MSEVRKVVSSCAEFVEQHRQPGGRGRSFDLPLPPVSGVVDDLPLPPDLPHQSGVGIVEGVVHPFLPPVSA